MTAKVMCSKHSQEVIGGVTVNGWTFVQTDTKGPMVRVEVTTADQLLVLPYKVGATYQFQLD